MNRRTIGLAALLLVIVAAGAYAKKQKPSKAAEAQQRAVHALDRLTFGPRPGDVQAVTAMGVDQWIDLQLHPERIDNSAMQSRLAEYRTLNMSALDMAIAFPPNLLVKAVLDHKAVMPSDPYRQAVYKAAMDRVEVKQEQKQAQATASSVTPTQPADAASKAMSKQQARSLADELIPLQPDVRMQRILALPIADQHDLLQGIGYPKRMALLAGLTPEQRETVVALNHPEAVVESELQGAKLLRAVYSQRQLEEVLTDFWFNHFNVFLGKGADHYLVTSYERDVIRPHVLGKFRDLLIATAQSPAMLFYLDNWQSEGPNSDAALGKPLAMNPMRPNAARLNQQAQNQQKRRNGLNENYARELMELHTLGVNGGYTQQDVTEVARVFTGWTIDEPQRGGGFLYRPRLHEPGDKTVLGHVIKATARRGHRGADAARTATGNRAIHLHRAGAALRLRQSSAGADRCHGKTFLKSDGDMREVLRTMFRSPQFWAPERFARR